MSPVNTPQRSNAIGYVLKFPLYPRIDGVFSYKRNIFICRAHPSYSLAEIRRNSWSKIPSRIPSSSCFNTCLWTFLIITSQRNTSIIITKVLSTNYVFDMKKKKIRTEITKVGTSFRLILSFIVVSFRYTYLIWNHFISMTDTGRPEQFW